ncbi:YbaB/EbfC family nucleoid-associated protein [Latilactobacillus graminis]|nr:YbaB/EbfC family nucleoid-associated protein [Latilactobacillus graminis]QFP79001.1 YbaB/EbfC family nucleoid-associated protein [Latilactobacillus graminis]
MRGMGNMQGMMKQMQKMQTEMGQTQEILNNTEFVGKAANDLVVVTMTGDKKMKDIAIKPEAIDPDDVDMLQDLIIMATNEAMSEIDQQTQAQMGKFTKGLPF